MKKTYTILMDTNPSKLSEAVNQYSQHGWMISGSLLVQTMPASNPNLRKMSRVSGGGEEIVYIQAMMRPQSN